MLTQKYNSKISIGLVSFIILVYIISIYYLIIDFKLGGLITIIGLGLFIVYLFSTTYYIINQATHFLLIKSGFLVNLPIDIHQITEIKTSKSWISSPALSLDRIEILYNTYDSVIISPKNKSQFIQELKQINPFIKVNI